jgi:REP element-mobilizing transposase RayT
MQFVRGESSFWINNQKLLPCHFSWQDDYFALSISHSQVDRVREYIKNQDKYHQNMSWQEENGLLIKKYGFQRLQG